MWWYFLLTLLIELPIVLLFYTQERKYVLIITILLNLFTWPLLHVLLFWGKININVLEFGVAIAEALGFYFLINQKLSKAFLVSFLANGISYGIGILLNNFL